MADSLVLTGVKDIKKHTGTEMLRLNPKGGGDTFQLKRWWAEGGKGTIYVDATVFDVTTGAGTVKLALDTNMSTNVRIDHDGSFNFNFIGINEVRRAALFTSDFALIEHYVFPSISGGKVMTVTPAGGASRPSAPAPKTLTAVTISGANSASDGDTETYTASKTGTATDVVYVYTSDVPEDTISGGAVTFDGVGDHIITVTGTSSDAGTSKTASTTVTIS
jgi:hypothetical protein